MTELAMRHRRGLLLVLVGLLLFVPILACDDGGGGGSPQGPTSSPPIFPSPPAASMNPDPDTELLADWATQTPPAAAGQSSAAIQALATRSPARTGASQAGD
jgi:hypothetical protein